MNEQAGDVGQFRQAMRGELLATREGLGSGYRATAGRAIGLRLLALLREYGARTVGAYLPIRHEPDSLPWIEEFIANGGTIALPVVVARARPLVFSPWAPGHSLQPGGLGTSRPAAHVSGSAGVTPDVLVIPLVGFDDDGYRLGYGGGFYDRTLAEQAYAGTQVIGVGFEAARVPTIYPQPHDRPMHRIVTEAAERHWDERRVCTMSAIG